MNIITIALILWVVKDVCSAGKKNCSDTSLGFSPACFNVCKRQIRINDLEKS